MTPSNDNPLLKSWDTPYALPPFAQIRPEHFEPAFDEAMARQLAEVDAIAADPAEPDFDNTIAALDRSGEMFHRIQHLFYNLTASETSAELQCVQRMMAPRLAAHDSAVHMHQGLFARIEKLCEKCDELALGAEQERVLERFHLDFVREGARLEPQARAQYARLMGRLAELTTRFGQNVLADEAAFRLVLRDAADFDGLPDFVRAAACEAARERGVGELGGRDGRDGKNGDVGLITLSRSLIVPFLTFSRRRDLREQAWRAWTTRGEHEGEHDNRQIAREILALRLQQARAHGYACYADYALADTMAQTQTAVDQLLQQVWVPAKARADAERAELQALADAEPEPVRIEAWDWRYYAEKLRQQRYELDEAQIKPYFALPRMVEAAFDCAQRLFGLSFVPQPQVQAYHADVRVYEVNDREGKLLGVFLHDNHARASKRSGAWMSALRVQSRHHGEGALQGLPVILNNNNFAKASAGEPTLLSFDDVRTLFHEFGHGLHGLLSKVGYERLAGTAVLRDFVELPSQIFEHWLEQPEVLKAHARHWQTDAPIPDELVQRLLQARTFNQGYESVRYAASALVDLAAHASTVADIGELGEFEAAQLERIGAPADVGVNHRLCHFQHLFSGSGYAAQYYVYLWAEVLDADGFDAFVEAGDPFDAEVAARLLRYVYSAGNSIEPNVAYRAFRGRAPTVVPMLRNRGLTGVPA